MANLKPPNQVEGKGAGAVCTPPFYSSLGGYRNSEPGEVSFRRSEGRVT